MAVVLYFPFSKPGGFQLSETKETTYGHLQNRNAAIHICQGCSLSSSSPVKDLGV